MSCRYLTGHQDSCPSNGYQVTCPTNDQLIFFYAVDVVMHISCFSLFRWGWCIFIWGFMIVPNDLSISQRFLRPLFCINIIYTFTIMPNIVDMQLIHCTYHWNDVSQSWQRIAMQQGMSAANCCQGCYPDCLSSSNHCNSFEEWVLVDFICMA